MEGGCAAGTPPLPASCGVLFALDSLFTGTGGRGLLTAGEAGEAGERRGCAMGGTGG